MIIFYKKSFHLLNLIYKIFCKINLWSAARILKFYYFVFFHIFLNIFFLFIFLILFIFILFILNLRFILNLIDIYSFKNYLKFIFNKLFLIIKGKYIKSMKIIIYRFYDFANLLDFNYYKYYYMKNNSYLLIENY